MDARVLGGWRMIQTPTTNEIATARRVLEALTRGHMPARADAVLLRLWIGPHRKIRLVEIAKAIIEAYSKQKTT
jgi:hypothetical protein